MGASVGRVERTERLLNLVFCLMASRRPVSRAVIQESVPGYGSGQADAAFERMFERDKDELRGMGIPVDTVLDVNGDVEGYRINVDQYQLPPIDFSARELAVIALAASVWDEAILGPVATTALRKIEAAEGAPPVSPADYRMSVQVAASDAALMPMLQAVREQRTVTFDYRAASSETSTRRRVDPWGVVSQAARWYVVGYDHDRTAPRVFRLSRITGSVTVTAAAQLVERTPDLDVRAMVTSIEGDAPSTATVHVRAGEAAQLRRMSSHGVDAFSTGEIDISAASRMQLIAALMGAGPSATVLAPEDVRADVIAGLSQIAREHEAAS